MKDKKRLKTAMVAAFCLVTAVGAAAPAWRAVAEGYPVAGVAPSERPVGAPKLTQAAKGDAWEKNAYKGVSKPYPPSVVNMLRDQGGWYTPFFRKGMPGRYDLRNLHSN